MLHRGIKFVHAAVLAFSAILAFLFMRELDDQGIFGDSARVWVYASDDSVSASRVADSISDFSAERSVIVAREVPDLSNPDQVRHLYVPPGLPEAEEWLSNGYPDFSQSFDTKVHRIGEISERDPRGAYYVFGSSSDAHELASRLSDLGLESSVSDPLSYLELARLYSNTPLFWSFCVIALATIAMTGASVLLGAKGYAVLRLQGRSSANLLARDLRQLAFFWISAFGLVAAAVLTFLGLYNNFAWVGRFSSIAGVFAGAYFLLALATHALVLALTSRVNILQALKGELPSQVTTFAVYLVRIPALILAVGLAMNVAYAQRDISVREESRDYYAQAGKGVTIRLNGDLPTEADAMISRIGQWIRESDKEGSVILAGRRDLQNISTSRLPAGEVMFVNEKYMAEQSVIDAGGKRIPASIDGTSSQVRLILPPALTGYAKDIADAIPGVLNPDSKEKITFDILESKGGQSLFGYNSGNMVQISARSPKEDRSLVQDPVLVVVPNGSKFVTNDLYTSFASQEGVIFPNSSDALTAMKSGKMKSYVTSVRPVSEAYSAKLRETLTDLRVEMFNLAAVLAVLLITGAGVCIIYSRRNAQSIFVQYISGWRFALTYRFILAVEAALAIILALRVPYEAWQQRQQLEAILAAGEPVPFEPIELTALDFGVIGGVVTFELLAVLAALLIFHRRIIREGAASA
ncbi:hypothetical protein [Streptomyces sp. NBC_01637]|uniref:hypothetical protein n=1 Tax=unclassified Streptomyces TaxID=2593676 RepID=UPI003869689B|nr:hypothetical protein OH719_18830 [Streptomyces sp. NBC_01653]WTD91141.1 hypothetical protein OG891_28045 [Streptomyces sp. NBC_01637]